MSLLALLVLILVMLFVLWLLQHYVSPALPPPVGVILLAVVAIVFVLWLLSAFGLLPAINQPIVVR